MDVRRAAAEICLAKTTFKTINNMKFINGVPRIPRLDGRRYPQSNIWWGCRTFLLGNVFYEKRSVDRDDPPAQGQNISLRTRVPEPGTSVYFFLYLFPRILSKHIFAPVTVHTQLKDAQNIVTLRLLLNIRPLCSARHKMEVSRRLRRISTHRISPHGQTIPACHTAHGTHYQDGMPLKHAATCTVSIGHSILYATSVPIYCQLSNTPPSESRPVESVTLNALSRGKTKENAEALLFGPQQPHFGFIFLTQFRDEYNKKN